MELKMTFVTIPSSAKNGVRMWKLRSLKVGKNKWCDVQQYQAQIRFDPDTELIEKFCR